MATGFQVCIIAPQQTHVLRHTVLRPHQTLAEMIYDRDEEPGTIHLGAIQTTDDGSNHVFGCVTLNFDAPMPGQPEQGDVQLRAMAVDKASQGLGVGRALVEQAFVEAAERGGRRIWCNARVRAMGFYQRLGFIAHGQEFQIPIIGPHYVMSVAVRPRSR